MESKNTLQRLNVKIKLMASTKRGSIKAPKGMLFYLKALLGQTAPDAVQQEEQGRRNQSS